MMHHKETMSFVIIISLVIDQFNHDIHSVTVKEIVHVSHLWII